MSKFSEVFKTCVGCAVCGDGDDAGDGFYGGVGACAWSISEHVQKKSGYV